MARKKQSNNTSGINGVSLCHTKSRYTGIVYAYWQATARINGKNVAKSFSVDKYGDNEAFVMACAQRDKMRRRIKHGQ